MHHLLVYECHGKINDSLLYGPGFDCYATANMPLKDCYSYGVVAAWAVGGKVGQLDFINLTSLGNYEAILNLTSVFYTFCF